MGFTPNPADKSAATATKPHLRGVGSWARYFGNSPQFWMGLQTDYDLELAADRLGSRLDREVRPRVVAEKQTRYE